MERPASTLAKANIFDYKIDLDKILKDHIIPGEIIFDKTPKDNKGHKVLKEYTAEEIKSVEDFVIKGDYKVPNSNFYIKEADQ